MMQQAFRRKRWWVQGLGVAVAVTLLACGGADPEPQPEPQPEPEPAPVTPIAHAQVLEAQEQTPLSITLEGEAGPGESVVYTLERTPKYGQLEGTPPEVTYVPPEGFFGIDVFSFSVAVGERRSSEAVVLVEVLNTPFYSITRGSTSTESLLHHTGPRGEVTLVGATGHALISLKFDPTDGTLYATTRRDDFEEKCDNCLVTLDLETGAASVVAPLTEAGELRGPVPSIAFTSDGSLYGWSEYGDDPVKIDKVTGELTVLGESGVSSWGHGMWTTPDDTLWFLNGDGDVYTVAADTGVVTLVHEPSVLEASHLYPQFDLQLRGDRNPVTGRYWGVLGNSANHIIQAVIDAEQARYVAGTPLVGPPLTHNLAFVPLAP